VIVLSGMRASGWRPANQSQTGDQEAGARQAPNDGADNFKGIAQLRVIDGQGHDHNGPQQTDAGHTAQHEAGQREARQTSQRGEGVGRAYRHE